MSEEQDEKSEINEYISHPHDKLFKVLMRDPKNAADFLRNHLPPEIVEMMDLEKYSSTCFCFTIPAMDGRAAKREPGVDFTRLKAA